MVDAIAARMASPAAAGSPLRIAPAGQGRDCRSNAPAIAPKTAPVIRASGAASRNTAMKNPVAMFWTRCEASLGIATIMAMASREGTKRQYDRTFAECLASDSARHGGRASSHCATIAPGRPLKADIRHKTPERVA